jgi:hypothetical protein
MIPTQRPLHPHHRHPQSCARGGVQHFVGCKCAPPLSAYPARQPPMLRASLSPAPLLDTQPWLSRKQRGALGSFTVGLHPTVPSHESHYLAPQPGARSALTPRQARPATHGAMTSLAEAAQGRGPTELAASVSPVQGSWSSLGPMRCLCIYDKALLRGVLIHPNLHPIARGGGGGFGSERSLNHPRRRATCSINPPKPRLTAVREGRTYAQFKRERCIRARRPVKHRLLIIPRAQSRRRAHASPNHRIMTALPGNLPPWPQPELLRTS